MKMLKQLIILCIVFILLMTSSCTSAEAEKEINALKAEIALLKRNESMVIDPLAERREEIIERYGTGEKKLIITYSGSGSYEFISKKMTYYKNGQIKQEENYQNSELHGDYREYYKNGQISVKCSYNEGKKNGEFFNSIMMELYGNMAILPMETMMVNILPILLMGKSRATSFTKREIELKQYGTTIKEILSIRINYIIPNSYKTRTLLPHKSE